MDSSSCLFMRRIFSGSNWKPSECLCRDENSALSKGDPGNKVSVSSVDALTITLQTEREILWPGATASEQTLRMVSGLRWDDVRPMPET